MKILFYKFGGADRWADVTAAFPGHEFVYASDAKSAAAEIQEAEVMILEGGGIEPELLEQATSLRWLQVASAGVEHIANLDLFRSGRVTVTNIRVLLGTHVAETAVALLTGLTRGVAHAAVRQQEHRWDRDYGYDELTDKRALVVGTGGIGRAVAKRYCGLEMKVVGVDIVNAEPDDYVSVIHPISDLLDVLPTTDVVTVCCPYTPETHHLIDEQALAALPDDAYVINVSRGKVVDTSALVRSLRDGRLRGAGLDVVEEEPLASSSEIWDAPNLILTPHIAGMSPRRAERVDAFIIDNMERYLRGDALLNVVDAAVGY